MRGEQGELREDGSLRLQPGGGGSGHQMEACGRVHHRHGGSVDQARHCQMIGRQLNGCLVRACPSLDSLTGARPNAADKYLMRGSGRAIPCYGTLCKSGTDL